MIKRSTFRRIMFFVAITVTYISYRVVQYAFYDNRMANGEREIKAVALFKEGKKLSSKIAIDGASPEVPYNTTIETSSSENSGTFFDLSIPKKARRNYRINVGQKTLISRKSSGSSSGSSMTGASESGGGYSSSAGLTDNQYTGMDWGSGSSAGGGGGAGGNGVAIASSDGGGSEDGTSGGGLELGNLTLNTATSASSSGNSGANSAGGSARLGISTTPSVGGTSNPTPTVQGGGGPPPPPPPPAPLDTHSVIFILMGAAMGLFILLKDSKKTSSKTA